MMKPRRCAGSGPFTAGKYNVMAHEFNGRKYGKASAHQKEWGTRLIGELALKGNERVLDLGCGDGILTARIADLIPNGKVTGIDASIGMIDTARLKKRRNLRFILMDIDNLDFIDEFDIIFSNAALHWIRDHGHLLGNVRRALRDGGCVRFSFAGDGNCAAFFRVIREAMALERFSSCFDEFEWPWFMPGVDEYRALIEKSGFHDTLVRGENADRFFPDRQAMTGWIDQPSIVPFLARVPEPEKQAFRDFVVRRMIEETEREDGRCFETFRRVKVSAKK